MYPQIEDFKPRLERGKSRGDFGLNQKARFSNPPARKPRKVSTKKHGKAIHQEDV